MARVDCLRPQSVTSVRPLAAASRLPLVSLSLKFRACLARAPLSVISTKSRRLRGVAIYVHVE
eukprot:3563627-Lingulodinium_polyedra.AAC.1